MGIEPQPSEVSKKAIKNVRKIEIPTDTPTVLELGDTAADIQRRRKEREGEEPEKQQRREAVKVKWTQRVEESPAHLISVKGFAMENYPSPSLARLSRI